MAKTSITDWQNLDTLSGSSRVERDISELRAPGLTILAHPDVRRVGERAVLTSLLAGNAVALSRLEPLFAVPGQARRRPLAVPHLSRQPLKLITDGADGICLLKHRSRTHVAADGVTVDRRRDFSGVEIDNGVVLVLADRIALLLHPLDPTPPTDVPRCGLVGESPGIIAVRQQITRIADLEVPALVRGETGTGKELVATGIHQASSRRSRPFVTVNMGAVPATLAAAELFGAARGAYTGADQRRTGYFNRADRGTLFLDEIGETPPEVQVLLLRALETGVVQPVGAESSQQFDVRVLAATDVHLEAEVAARRFRAPLLHRLSGYEIRLPPLRERREDIGRLLLHFLRQELEEQGEAWRLDDSATASRPWLSASVVARLVAWSWPGNVRQLRNVARQLVIGNRGEPCLTLVAEVEAMFRDSDSSAAVLAPALSASAALAKTGQPDARAEERAMVKTILMSDLVDSTRLVQRLGDRRSMEVSKRHDQAARGLLLEHGGREIDKADGFLMLFDRPIDALVFALEYHEALAELSRDLGVDLEARVGIHLGEVTLRHNDPAEITRGAKALEVEGIAKPTAARLMSLAGGAQTLLTRHAFDLAQQAAQADHPLHGSEVRWLDHGSYRLRGLAEPVEVYEVGVEGSAPLTRPAGSEKARRVEGVASPSSANARHRSDSAAEYDTEEVSTVLPVQPDPSDS